MLLSALALFAGCGKLGGPQADGGRTANELVRDIVGLSEAPRIEFSDFYGRLLDEGRRWAGDKLRIGRISVGPAGAAGRQRGAAPVWLATVVRCDREEESGGVDKNSPPIKLCSGEARQAVMSNLNIDGYVIGFELGKEESFFGSAAKPEQIKIAATEAQRLADASIGGKVAGAGQYIYELTVRREDGVPVWRVVRDCQAGKTADGQCPGSGSWTVMINAESGEVLSREPAEPRD